MPIDEQGQLYDANRRMEAASPGVFGETNLSKLMVAADSSPVRKASRSKIVSALGNVQDKARPKPSCGPVYCLCRDFGV